MARQRAEPHATTGQQNFTGPDAALIAAAHELLAAARKVDALSIQTDAHNELRAAIARQLSMTRRTWSCWGLRRMAQLPWNEGCISEAKNG